MTQVIGNVIVIEPEKPQQCDMCGKIDELRPYGPNKECICCDCADKLDPIEVCQQMYLRLIGRKIEGLTLEMAKRIMGQDE